MHFCSHVFVHICVVFATHRNVTFNYCSSLLDPVSKMNIEFCIYFCIAAVQLQMNLSQTFFIYIFLSEPQDPESVMKQFSSLTNIEIKKNKIQHGGDDDVHCVSYYDAFFPKHQLDCGLTEYVYSFADRR